MNNPIEINAVSAPKAFDIKRLRSDLSLLMAALIWGTAFVAQRLGAEQSGIFIFNGLRFLLAVLVLLPFIRFHWKVERTVLPQVLLTGLVLFAASTVQQAGLQFTTAGNAGFITTLYVVLVPILLMIFWRQKISRLAWAAAVLAVAGGWLLSTRGTFQMAPGDGLELAGSLLWAFHVILIGRLAQQMDPLKLAVGQSFVAAILSLTTGLFFETHTLAQIASSWLPLLYLGIISTAVAFTLQIIGQRHAPATDAAVIMSMEAVFAVISGYFLLGEVLYTIQIIGCAMIFVAMLLAQVRRT
ncbi:MAG TPA: DMT family transporter [Anaerolineaceae bacterium]|nr:DMT family transporter [Anaerolineaceae bacterium]